MIQAVLRRYAACEARTVTPFLDGGPVLDLGAGEAYVTEGLRRHFGARVCAADIGPYRRAQVPYVVYDGARLPFRDAAFDITLLLLTLHHCDDPDRVIDEAIRVTRSRLIVLESVYRTRRERFLLERLDPWFNGRRHHGTMRPALHIATAEQWRRRFERHRLHLTATAEPGGWWERLVHRPHLFVLDVEPGRETRLVT